MSISYYKIEINSPCGRNSLQLLPNLTVNQIGCTFVKNNIFVVVIHYNMDIYLN